ncbi:MAG TPA: Gfo/Idh/MocA family oxidoreductase [Thermomicrobiales bacterium]|nr:Gfo/Idh/MocA family oxidoreductase [Thermomicrobiales bacterium]
MSRLGVIGYGRRMRHMLEVIARFNAGADIVAVIDPNERALRAAFPDALASVTFYDDVDRMLDGEALDGVLIGTRCTLHTPYAVKVLERNLPLFLEKPVATDWDQLATLQAATERTRSQVVVSFPLRVSPLCDAAREIIDSGAIGTVEQVQAVNNVPFYAGGYYHGWMRDEAQTGGLWLQKATHDLDYLNSLIRQQPTRIVAMESKTVFRGDMPAGLRCVDCWRQVECPESPYNLFRQGVTPEIEPNDWLCSFAVDTGNHDSASALIHYESGVHAVYTQNFYTRRGATARGATLIGYLGTVAFDWYRDELTIHHHHTNRVERHRFESTGEGHHGGDEALVEEFLNAVSGRETTRAPLAAGILSAQMCLMARDSCATNTFREFHPLSFQQAVT